jgi:hypothetical protein
MSPELATALIAALTALLGGVGGFLAKSRLSDVIVAPHEREKTAVDTMASMLDKAIDGLVRMSVSTERMGSHLSDHSRVVDTQWAMSREMLLSIQDDIKRLISLLNEDKQDA